MSFKVLAALVDWPCADAATGALRGFSAGVAHPQNDLLVLSVVQPFRTVYVHKHPLIGWSVRHLLQQVNREQVEAADHFVRETASRFRMLGWDARHEVRQGQIAEELLLRCQAMRPDLFVVCSCLSEQLAPWGWRAARPVWPDCVRKVACPALVVKHLSFPSRQSASDSSINPANRGLMSSPRGMLENK